MDKRPGWYRPRSRTACPGRRRSACCRIRTPARSAAADAAEPGINGYTPPDITVPNDDFGTQTHRSNQWDTRRFALQTSDGFKCLVLGFSPAVGKRIRCMRKTDGMATQPKPLSAVAPDLTNYGSALSFRQRAGAADYRGVRRTTCSSMRVTRRCSTTSHSAPATVPSTAMSSVVASHS